jgi:hypothetical protein
MSKRNASLIVALFLIACAGLGGWLGTYQRNQSAGSQNGEKHSASISEPRPSPAATVGTARPPASLFDRYAELVRNANLGNADSAYELALAREDCFKLRSLTMLSQEAQESMRDTSLDADEVTRLQRQQVDNEARIKAARANCVGNPDVTFAELHDLWSHAAQLGSLAAQYQYAINPWLNPATAASNLERWREWRDHAIGYLDAVLQSGDGRAAVALAAASELDRCGPYYPDAGHDFCAAGNFLGEWLPQDPAIAYRYYLLAELLGSDADADWLNAQLQKLAAMLSPDQIAQAQAQAQQISAEIKAAHR